MGNHRARRRKTEARLRLVFVHESAGKVIVDAVVVETDGDNRWPASGSPLALKMTLPASTWMAEALFELLRAWAADDSLVTATLLSNELHEVARLGRADSSISLELLQAA